MQLRSEHYKTHGELSPIAIYTARTFRVLIIIVLLVMCRRTIPDSAGKCLAASVTLYSDYVAGSFTYPVEREFWPEPVVHAVWPEAVLYLTGRLQALHAYFFQPEERFVADQYGCAIYSKTDPKMSVYSPDGERVFEFSSTAWPRLVGSANWIFLFTGDQSGIAFLDRLGGKMTGDFQQFASMVTAWAYTGEDESAVLGMMDGSIEKISVRDNRGLWRIEPPAGRLPVIKGLAAGTGGTVAVSGSDPEHIMLIDHKGQVLWSHRTEGDLRTRVMVRAAENFVAAHTRDTASILRLDTGKTFAELKPVAADGERITWVSLVESTASTASTAPSESAESADSPKTLFLSVSQGSRTAIYHIAENGRVRDCAVIDSPWAELALSSGTLAITTRGGLDIYQNPGEAP